MRASTGHSPSNPVRGRPGLTTIPPAAGGTVAAARKAMRGKGAFALAVLAGVAGATAGLLAGSRGTHDPAMPVPVAGSRTLQQPLRVGVALDESGSITTTDPGRAGREATLTICDWLVCHSDNPADQVGLVRFADTAATTPIARAGNARTTIEQALRDGPDVGGGTQLRPAVDALCRLLPGGGGAHAVAILITDGQVAEPDTELRNLIGQLRQVADAVYLIALDQDGAWTSRTHQRYRSLGLTDQVAVSQVDETYLAAAIATLLARETGQETR